MDNRSTFMSNNFQDGSYYYSNTYGSQYYYKHNHPTPNQPPVRYPREFYNSTQQTNNSYQQNYPQKECYYCKSPGHIRAHCPELQKNNSIQRQKTSS